MRIVLLREKYILTKLHVQAEHLYFYPHFALDIILGDRCDRKTPKKTILFKSNLIFWWLNLETSSPKGNDRSPENKHF